MLKTNSAIEGLAISLQQLTAPIRVSNEAKHCNLVWNTIDSYSHVRQHSSEA